MKTREQIESSIVNRREEVEELKEQLAFFPNSVEREEAEEEIKIHNHKIKTLEWVLKEN